MTDTEFRAKLVELRDLSFQAFQALSEHRRNVEQVAGWIPSLDGPQLLQTANLLNATITDLSSFAVKFVAALDAMIERPTESDVGPPA